MNKKQIEELTAAAMAILKLLPNEKRVEVFYSFCIHCGTAEIPCFCWHD